MIVAWFPVKHTKDIITLYQPHAPVHFSFSESSKYPIQEIGSYLHQLIPRLTLLAHKSSL